VQSAQTSTAQPAVVLVLMLGLALVLVPTAVLLVGAATAVLLVGAATTMHWSNTCKMACPGG
jgi:hypothetical protein